MEGAVRLFAGEFNQATLSIPGEDDKSAAWVVTPSGARFRQVFLAGALTEVNDDGDMVYARLADPTGGFDLACGGKLSPVAESIKTILLPSFISVSGRAQIWRKNDRIILSVRPEYVRQIDRATRDQWVLTTAQATLRRLESARAAIRGESPVEMLDIAVRHYGLTPARLEELAAMAEGAVTGVKPAETGTAPQPDARNLIMELLKTNGGPRGMAVQEIIDTLAGEGVFQDIVLKTVESLIVEDECYQPQKGYIRLL